MLALLAAVDFLLAFIFRVASVDTGDWDTTALIALGLFLLSLHLAWPIALPIGRSTGRERVVP